MGYPRKFANTSIMMYANLMVDAFDNKYLPEKSGFTNISCRMYGLNTYTSNQINRHERGATKSSFYHRR